MHGSVEARAQPQIGRLAPGLPGFYKGMRTKIVQSILAAALLMAIKEEISTASHVILAKSAAVLPVVAAPEVLPEEVISPAPVDV